MPAFEYNSEHKAFVKECSCCHEEFVGTDNQEESEKIFSKHFAFSHGSAQCADGFQSRCRPCNNYKRRELGLRVADLEKMWLDQQGKCAICNKDITLEFNAGTDIHAHVDHNAETGKIRGLLCGNCNRGIGCLSHSKTILTSAIAYLENRDG